MSNLDESKTRYKKGEVYHLPGLSIEENTLQELLNILVKLNLTNKDDKKWKQFFKYFVNDIHNDESIGMGTSKNTLKKIRKDFERIPKDNLWIVVDEIRFGCGTFDASYRVIDRDNSNCLVLDDINLSRTFYIENYSTASNGK